MEEYENLLLLILNEQFELSNQLIKPIFKPFIEWLADKILNDINRLWEYKSLISFGVIHMRYDCFKYVSNHREYHIKINNANGLYLFSVNGYRYSKMVAKVELRINTINQLIKNNDINKARFKIISLLKQTLIPGVYGKTN